MKLLIFDGHYLLHRSLHIGALAGLENSSGIRTGGLFGVLRTIIKLAKDHNPDRIVICFDGGHSRRRQSILEQYKGDRVVDESKLSPEDLAQHTEFWEFFNHSLSLCQECLPLFGIKFVRMWQREADDLCCLVRHLHPTHDVVLVSDDSDFYQLVDVKCSVWRDISGVLITWENLREKTSLRNPFEAAVWKAIEGGHDNLPNIPDVSGGSVKKAFELFGQSVTLTNVELFLDFCLTPGNPARVIKIGEHKSQVLRNLLISCIHLEEFSLFDMQAIRDWVFDPDVIYRPVESMGVLGRYELTSISNNFKYWEPVFERLV